MSDTKTHILQTALRLFLREGYRDVTLHKLLTAAEVSKGAFYHHWSGKLELFRDVVEHFFLTYFRETRLGGAEAEGGAETAGATETEGGAETAGAMGARGTAETRRAEFPTFLDVLEETAAQFQSMMDELFGVVGDEGGPFGYYLLVLEAIRLFPDLRDGLAQQYERFTAELTKLAEQAQERGEISRACSAREVAELIIPQSEGTALLTFIRGRRDLRDALGAQFRSLYAVLRHA